jgi:DNA-binding GntR family transcriptional regulator
MAMRHVEADDPRPPFLQIADDMRDQIERGELAPGARLPSGRTLAKTYEVALMTAQNALQRLRDEDLVYSTSRGYFVGKSPQAENESSIAGRLEEMETEIRDLRSRVEILEADQ